MAKYKNTNDAYGLSGPFEAESREALADEMAETFREWAKSIRDREAGFVFDMDAELAAMRKEFIAGLEEVV